MSTARLLETICRSSIAWTGRRRITLKLGSCHRWQKRDESHCAMVWTKLRVVHCWYHFHGGTRWCRYLQPRMQQRCCRRLTISRSICPHHRCTLLRLSPLIREAGARGSTASCGKDCRRRWSSGRHWLHKLGGKPVSSPPHRALMVCARRSEYRWVAVLGKGCSRTGTRSWGGTMRQAYTRGCMCLGPERSLQTVACLAQDSSDMMLLPSHLNA